MTRPTDSPTSLDWRGQLREAIRDPDRLLTLLGLPDGLRSAARAAAARFPLVVPRAFLSRIETGNADDPLLRQVLPIDAELADTPGFVTNPVGDRESTLAGGLLQKYASRVLLITAGVCAVHCRYCFRRHFPYDESPSGLEQWEPAIAAIAADPSLEEVILSGGDPLTRTDRWLAALIERLAAIPHLRRLRVHTRLPIVIPDRVDEGLLGWIASTGLAPTVVVHANHHNEIDENCASALLRLVKAGVPVLNQSVLLRGVNDDPDTLCELSKRLLDARVIPYYLHQLDPVAGAAHFAVPVEQGLRIVAELRRRLPGFGVPRYVREVVGAAHKVEVR